MPGFDLIDISMFRLRLGANQPSKWMSDLHHVRRTDALGLDAAEWSTIPDATELGKRIFCGKFSERNLFNIPGPFYGAQTDTCESGPLEAPEIVMLDGDGQEFVFRQPTTADELRRIIGAARCDPFAGYGADGDEHWNIRLMREWWSDMESRIVQVGELAVTNKTTELLVSFWTSQAESYLRCYAFFVDNRRLPAPTDRLPDL